MSMPSNRRSICKAVARRLVHGSRSTAVSISGYLHQFHAFERLNRAEQYAAADSRPVTTDIEHKGAAIDEVDVGVAAP